jgi:acid phosphatase (class A)
LSGGTGHNGFNKCVKDGLKITADDTKCTYTVLDTVYQAVTANTATNNSTSIAWALAEMLTELTPSGKSSTKYFEEANTYGGVPDLIGNQAVYNKRLNGAIVYTKLRYDKFDEITAMAVKSRNELTSNGVTEAKLISPPGYSNRDINVVAGGKTYNYKYKSFNFPRNSLIDVVNNDLVPDKTTEHTIAEIAPIDKSSMVQILTNNETKACSDKFKNAYYDNFFCSARLYEILNGKITDYDNLGVWLKFYDDVKDPQDAILNGLKYKRTEGRLRPMNQIVGFDEYGNEIIADRVSCQDCDDANFKAEVERVRKLCDDTDTCSSDLQFAGDKHSYPSGHSGKAYIAGLAYLEATGKNKMSRIDEFSFNRAIVRAHWVSDTVAGKVLASMAIGVLNGTKEFLDEVSAIRGDTPTPPEPPTPTDCICEEVKSKYSGPNDTCSKDAKTKEYIGSGKTGDNCGETIPKATRISIEEGSGAATALESIKVEPQEGNVYYIYGDILENTSGALRKTRIYFNVKEKDSEGEISDESYINIYQAG